MAKDKKLVAFEGKGRPSLTKESLRQFKEEFGIQCEFVTMMAELTRIKYNALKDQGFSDAEALELSKTIF